MRGLTALAMIGLGCGMAFSQSKMAGWSTGYHTTWGKQSTANINYKAYTHLMYFSGSINPPSASTGKAFTDIVHKNNSKAILCIGGWGAANAFESSSNSAEKRAAFIIKMIDGMKNGGFDGLDIDWEEEGGGISNNYTLLLQELRTAMNKLTPKPLLTIATADNQVPSAAATKDYVDQMNVMSYWTLAGGMPAYMKKFTDKGVPKSVLGVGYGYDTDNEVDVDNPADIDLKCKFAVENGYGGIMVWEIANACKACDETTIKYVDKNMATGVHPHRAAKAAYYQARTLAIVNNAATGVREIHYTPASKMGSPKIQTRIFNLQGGLLPLVRMIPN